MTVIPFPKSPSLSGVQLSAYPQEDGSTLYAVEILNSDDTWDIAATTKDKGDGMLLASGEAARLGVPLLPVSTFPGRAA